MSIFRTLVVDYVYYIITMSPFIQTQEEEEKQTTVKQLLFDLYKYKVVKIISSGMLALHSELQQLFYIKVGVQSQLKILV